MPIPWQEAHDSRIYIISVTEYTLVYEYDEYDYDYGDIITNISK